MSANNNINPWRLLGLTLLLAAIIMMAIFGKQWWPAVQETVSAGGISGFMIFMGAFIALTTLCFPVSVLGFTAGMLYGPWWGLLLLFPSGLISGSLMFLLGKTLLRGFVAAWIQRNPKLSALENAAGEQALRLNILSRLSPFNYGIISYALATGKTGFKNYFIGLLVILPSMAAQVWVGALAQKTGDLGREGLRENPLEMAMLILGVLFFVILTWQVGKMVQRALALPVPENSAPTNNTTAE
ncbi:MAG: TVP38/TMEM64 family protein [bacterium]|nr:TVP38/TMEM64 family protein [bacterium]